MTTYSDDRSSRSERLSRLDQLEREIAIERDRLTSTDTDTGERAGDGRLSGGERMGGERLGSERPSGERFSGERFSGEGSDQARRTGTGAGRADSVSSVDLPELEERVTESQRKAWALGYQAGVSDSRTSTGGPTQNPFHPLRGL